MVVCRNTHNCCSMRKCCGSRLLVVATRVIPDRERSLPDQCARQLFARTLHVNGRTAAEALAGRFRAIRESELARLDKKLRDLTEDDRQLVEAIAAQVTEAIARVPQRALCVGVSQQAVDVLIRVFELTPAAP